MAYAIMRTLVVSLSGALFISSPAFARMQIGETRPFTMDTPAVWQTANYLVRQKSAGRYMAVGGSIERIGENSYLLCGYSIDMHRQGQKGARPVGFVIITDNAGDHASVIAPATQKQQEAKGCWPGERERLEAEADQIVAMSKASRATETTTAPDGVGAADVKQP